MKKILLIEDDVALNNMLATVLGNQYAITQAFSGSEGLLHTNMTAFDLILLDLMLPGKTGEEVLAEIREKLSTPVIMLTAVSDKAMISKLLMAGADDYVTKPFDIDELKARIMVQLRQLRGAQQDEGLAKTGYKSIVLHPSTFEIGRGSERVQLSKKEWQMLVLLIENPQKIYTK